MEATITTPSKKGTAQVKNTPVEEIHRLFKLQKDNRWRVAQQPVSERKKKLKKLEKAVFQYRKEIQEALYQDFRKPPFETDVTETFATLTELRHVIANLDDWLRPEPVENTLAYTGTSAEIRYEPKGVGLIISPWNYPFNLCMLPLISAIAAGCTAIVKPSEYTPHTSSFIKNMLSNLFDESEVAVVEGDHTVAGELLKLEFDHIYFTGSPAVGKIVMRAAAENLTSVTLELGGKSPVIIDRTARIEEAARKITWGKFLNNGQTCIAPDYLLVNRENEQLLLDNIQRYIEKFYGDLNGLKNNPDYCRIVNQRHFNRIKQLIEDALEKGARLVYGGQMDESENYISPTILASVTDDMKVMQEEIFGPVLPVKTYEQLDEALGYINSKPKPLAMYIFSRKDRTIEYILKNTTAGGTCINDTIVHHSHPNLPFGGVNNSGIGKGHGIFGIREFSNARAVLRQPTPLSNAQIYYPPYKGGIKQKALDFTLKYL